MGAQHPAAQQLQYFLSEAAWDGGGGGRAAPGGAPGATPPRGPTPSGVLVLDDTGDRKDGTQTAHVARQYLGIIGKVDNGIVAVTSLWADERVYYPLHVEPYTPARACPGGGRTPPSGPSPASPWSWSPPRGGVPFRAAVADSFYGDNVAFEVGPAGRVPYVLGLKPSKGPWAPAEDGHPGGGRPRRRVGRRAAPPAGRPARRRPGPRPRAPTCARPLRA